MGGFIKKNRKISRIFFEISTIFGQILAIFGEILADFENLSKSITRKILVGDLILVSPDPPHRDKKFDIPLGMIA